MNEFDALATRGWSVGKLKVVGLLALVLPTLYVVGIWNHPGHGPPYMFSNLWGPESSHTTVGLFLVFTGMIFSPMIAAGLGIWLMRRSGSAIFGWFLFVAGLGLLVINLLTRQPYAG